MSDKQAYSSVGHSVNRVDARAKVTGRAVYAADLWRRDMLCAKILRSPHAHANIVNINTEKAKAMPGVEAVLTYKDVPDIYFTSCGHPHPSDTPEDTLILSKRLRYCGDPVAAVAATTREIARKALDLIEVEYEVLPAYLTPSEALAAGAVEIHEGSGNICGENEYEIGDVGQAMREAAHVVVDEFDTPIVSHSPIEPHASMTELDSNGRVIIHTCTQVSSILRERTALALGKKIRDIRVIRTTVGGGFGGKQEPIYEILNAAMTIATGKPVKLELTREECLACTRTRHASHFRLRTAIDKDGKILARELIGTNNGGAYASHGHNVLLSVAAQFCLLYPTENLHFKGTTAYTNIPIAGAFRAYGIPQYAFAMESHIDHLARTVGKDPLDYRKEHMFRIDSPILAPHFSINTFGLPDIIKKCEEAIEYENFRKLPKSEGPIKRGIGVGLCSYGQSCFPWSVELSGARVMVNEDGSASLFVGSAEIGQGSDTVMQQIAAETLGIPHHWVHVISNDTDLCPFDIGAFASRQTYVTGHAVKKAAQRCKDQILDYVAENYTVERSRLDIWNGLIVDQKSNHTISSLEDVVMKMVYNIPNPVTICHDASYHPTDNVLTYGCSMALVEVDTTTGKVEVKKLASAMDSGRLINPLAAMGQLYGGNTMSLGFGLYEQLLIDPKSGKTLNDNMLDYKIPSFADIPEIEVFFVETDEPSSAYGNKSLGEPPNIAPAVAVRNAVLDATGVAINEIPLTPERVYEALKKDKEEKEQNIDELEKKDEADTYVFEAEVLPRL